MPTRSPVKTVWPPAPMVDGSELSYLSPFDEKSARTWLSVSAATEVTHGACENGLSDISAFVRPLLPAAKKTLTPRSETAFVATLTGARASNCWNELPQELLMTRTPHSIGWSSRWSYAVTTAVVNNTSPIE